MKYEVGDMILFKYKSRDGHGDEYETIENGIINSVNKIENSEGIKEFYKIKNSHINESDIISKVLVEENK